MAWIHLLTTGPSARSAAPRCIYNIRLNVTPNQERKPSLTFDMNQTIHLPKLHKNTVLIQTFVAATPLPSVRVKRHKLTKHTRKYAIKITWIPWRWLVFLFPEGLVNTCPQCTAQYRMQWWHQDFGLGAGANGNQRNCWGTKRRAKWSMETS